MQHRHTLISTMVFIMLFLASCFDIEEEFTIKPDGTGNYAMTLDMYKMMEMMLSLGGDDSSKSDSEINKTMDTTVFAKNNLSIDANLTSDELKLVEPSFARLKMNLAEKKFFIRYDFPVVNKDGFETIYYLTPKAMQLLALKNETESSDKLSTPDAAGIANTNQFFELVSTKNYFEKKVKAAALEAYYKNDSSLQQLRQFMGNAYITTVVHTPRPIKNCNHPLAKLSENKKTVTFKYSYTDYFERPELLAFKIEY